MRNFAEDLRSQPLERDKGVEDCYVCTSIINLVHLTCRKVLGTIDNRGSSLLSRPLLVCCGRISAFKTSVQESRISRTSSFSSLSDETDGGSSQIEFWAEGGD